MMKTIPIKGTIVSNDDKWIYDWFGIEAVCPKDVAMQLKEADGEEITVEINSGGGDVFAGNEIYYLISQYKGKKTNDIVGFAGSAASIIAMSSRCRIVPSGLVMIHNVSGGARGDYHVMDKTSEVLKTANKAISNAYIAKTGLSQEKLLELMDQEKWMDAKEALELGFVDEVINDSGKIANQPIKALYNSMFANVLSPEIIEKIRNTIKNPNDIQDNAGSDFLMQKMKSKLNLLKLKGEMRYEI